MGWGKSGKEFRPSTLSRGERPGKHTKSRLETQEPQALRQPSKRNPLKGGTQGVNQSEVG